MLMPFCCRFDAGMRHIFAIFRFHFSYFSPLSAAGAAAMPLRFMLPHVASVFMPMSPLAAAARVRRQAVASRRFLRCYRHID
jgi:hypothetical protein